MPFLAVIMLRNPPHNPGGWSIQNQGFGPAINVRYSGYVKHVAGNQPETTAIAPIGKDGIVTTEAIHNSVGSAFHLEQAFVIEYESLSGVRYRSTVQMIENQIRTEFEKRI